MLINLLHCETIYRVADSSQKITLATIYIEEDFAAFRRSSINTFVKLETPIVSQGKNYRSTQFFAKF